MKKGFTIIEVSILFVIFLIVAILVAPLSMDDTIQAKNTSKWRTVQQEFSNIFYAMEPISDESSLSFADNFNATLDNEIKNSIKPYKIKYMNERTPDKKYIFETFKTTYSNAVIATSFVDNADSELKGILMYDVNGKNGPNIWGKDVFGLNIYSEKLEPFGKDKTLNEQKRDCSKLGTGLSCSNFYLIGGNFD